MDKQKQIAQYDEPRRRLNKKFNFWRGIYNPDKHYILGRTLQNWGELFIFYSIFYIILAALFAICMQGLMWSLDENAPKWTLSESRIGDSPGLGFRPMSNLNQGSLIWINRKNASSPKTYIDLIDQFLKPYEQATTQPHENSVYCDFETSPPPEKVCRVNLSHFNKCTSSNSYGFNISQPCIFLKLNRIFNWKPVPYNVTYGADNKVAGLPETMPEVLKSYIYSLPDKERHQVFVSCEGQTVNDKENIGNITISPRGFPHYFYPFRNEKGYLSPLISVQFESPKNNTNINIECIAWAPNIVYHGGDRDRQGSIHFELMID